MACPSGWGSENEQTVCLLPTGMDKPFLHDTYCDSWTQIIDELRKAERMESVKMQHEPVLFRSFTKVWYELVPPLRVAKSGKAFWNTCTKLRGLNAAIQSGSQREFIVDALKLHRGSAHFEYKKYRRFEEIQCRTENHASKHFVFDFAENVLLPNLFR